MRGNTTGSDYYNYVKKSCRVRCRGLWEKRGKFGRRYWWVTEKRQKERWALCESEKWDTDRDEVQQMNQRERESKFEWKQAKSERRKDSDREKISPRGKITISLKFSVLLGRFACIFMEACLPLLCVRWEIVKRMEGAGSGRRGDSVKDAWVKGRWDGDNKWEGIEDVNDLSSQSFYPSTSFLLGHLTW